MAEVQVIVDPVAEEADLSGRDHTAVLDSTPVQLDGRALAAPLQSDILLPLFLKMTDTSPHGGFRFTNNSHDLLHVDV